MVNIDIVILSYSKNKKCYDKTKACLDSLFMSEDPNNIKFNVFLLESQPEVTWLDYPVQVINPPMPYGYHKFMNIGRKLGASPWVALCNNDLIFSKGWFKAILELAVVNKQILSFSPIDPHTQPKNGFRINSGNYLGYNIRQQISGWCIVQKREIYDVIGDLDEKFIHWFCDNDYGLTLYDNKIAHCLVTGSVVEHHDDMLGEVTIQTKSQSEIQELTYGKEEYFKEKWAKYLQ